MRVESAAQAAVKAAEHEVLEDVDGMVADVVARVRAKRDRWEGWLRSCAAVRQRLTF
jgi:hypothetical protein